MIVVLLDEYNLLQVGVVIKVNTLHALVENQTRYGLMIAYNQVTV